MQQQTVVTINSAGKVKNKSARMFARSQYATYSCNPNITHAEAAMSKGIIRGFEKGGLANLIAVPIFVIWLYGTLVLAGYIIMLLGAHLSVAVPVLHMKGQGVSGEIAKSSGGFFFIWTIIALGVTALFAVILSVCELWSLQRRKTR